MPKLTFVLISCFVLITIKTTAQTGLPLTQDFEGYPFTRFDRNTNSTITNFPEGEVVIGDGIGTIERSTLDFRNIVFRLRSTNSNDVTTAELVLTLDLATKDVNSFFGELSLDLYHKPASSFPINENDQIFVRGSENDTWIPIYNYGALQDENDLFVRVLTRGITPALQNVGQQYSSTFQIRILSQQGGELEIDNIVFSEVPDFDLSLSSADVPIMSPEFGAQETISIKLINLGLNTISSFMAEATVTRPDGTQQVVSETINQTINSLDTIIYSFQEKFDLSIVGNYSANFNVTLENDAVNENDSLDMQFGKSIAYTEGLPFFEDFDEFGRTAKANTNNQIQGIFAVFEGLPHASVITNGDGYIEPVNNRSSRRINDFRGGYVLLGSSGAGQSSSIIYSIDMSQYDVQTDQIRFSANSTFSSLAISDRFLIRGSVIDEWITLDDDVLTSGFGTQLLIRDDISALLSQNDQDYSSTTQIKIEQMSLSGFSFESVDYVALEEVPDQDLRPLDGREISTSAVPEISPALGVSESLEVQIINNGISAVTGGPIGATVKLPDGTITSYNSMNSGITIQPNDTVYLPVTSFADFSMIGNYEITFFSSLAEDVSVFNDTLEVIHTGKADIYTAGLPFVENLETNLARQRFEESTIFNFYQAAYGVIETRNPQVFGTSALSPGFDDISLENGGNASSVIFTLDLSDVSITEDELTLEAEIANRSSNVSQSHVSIRGNVDQPWVNVFSITDSIPSDFLAPPTAIEITDITARLAEANQTFGSTFQIRVSNNSTSTTTGVSLIDLHSISLKKTGSLDVANAIPDIALDEGYASYKHFLGNVFEGEITGSIAYSVSSSNEDVATVAIEGDSLIATEGTMNGVTEIKLDALDEAENEGSLRFELTSNNLAPVVSNTIENQMLLRNFGTSSISLENVFQDPGNDPLSFSVSPSDESILTATIQDQAIVLQEQSLGTITINLTATDDENASISTSFTVTIDNSAVVLTNSLEDLTFESGFISTSIDLIAFFEDADGDMIDFEVSSENEEVVSVSLEGTSTLVLSEEGIGAANIAVLAQDDLDEGTSATFAVVVMNPLGSSEDLDGLVLYPNPTQSVIFLDHRIADKKLILQDISGKEVQTVKNGNSLDFSNLPSSTYILSIVDINGNVLGVYKVIKK